MGRSPQTAKLASRLTALVLVAGAGLGLGAPAIAWGEGIGEETAAGRGVILTSEDLVADSAALFHLADKDASGLLSTEEFTGYLIERAEMSRFSGTIEISGRETIVIPLPEDARGKLDAEDRTALAAAALQVFECVGEDEMTAESFLIVQMDAMARSDSDDSLSLEGEELMAFVLEQAGAAAPEQG